MNVKDTAHQIQEKLEGLYIKQRELRDALYALQQLCDHEYEVKSSHGRGRDTHECKSCFHFYFH